MISDLFISTIIKRNSYDMDSSNYMNWDSYDMDSRSYRNWDSYDIDLGRLLCTVVH